MPFPTTCLHCGTVFQARTSRRSYCTRQCASTASNQGRKIDPDRPEKRCPGCDTVKLRADFYASKNSKDGMTSRCRECVKRIAADRRLLYRYGLTEGDYEAKLVKQGGVCAVCSEPPGVRRLHVDHDHETGKVRSLLCMTCNHLVGWLESQPERIAACRAYIERHAA